MRPPVPSENEWYKAAYYDPAGVYYDYPTGTDSLPNNNLPANDTGNSANFFQDNGYTNGNSPYPLTDAGAYTLSASPFGTFDQGGNVWELNETLVTSSSRGLRGGSWDFFSHNLHASGWNGVDPTQEGLNIGFRVASIPEPSTMYLAALSAVALLWRRTRAR